MTDRAPHAARPLWDPGAQPERTYEAWVRTVLACVVCGLFLARLTARSGTAALALAAIAGAGGVVLVVLQRRRLRAGSLRPLPAAVAGLTALVLVLAAGGLGLVLSSAVGLASRP